MSAQNEKLRSVAEALAATFEAAIANYEYVQAGSRGQRVSFHGDFSHVSPSVVCELRWWVRELREALQENE